MVVQIKAWGNGQGVRFSKEFLDTLEIHPGNFLEVQIVDEKIVLSKSFRHKTLEERAEEFEGKIGPYEEFAWGKQKEGSCGDLGGK